MTTDTDTTATSTRASRGAGALLGLVAAGIALALGHLASALTGPGSSPAVVVGSQLVDLAPTPVKDVVVRTVGTADKPLLIAAVVVVTLGLGALLGTFWRRRPGVTQLGIVAIGLVGVVLSLLRPDLGPLAVVPSGVAIISGLLAVQVLGRAAGTGSEPADGTSRRGFLAALGGGGALAVLAAAGGSAAQVVASAGSAARRAFSLPAPRSVAPQLPADVQVPGNTPFTTSIEEFYRIDISLVTPRHDAEGWTLTIDGEVEQPLTLSYADLLELPMVERDITLTCVSNEVGGSLVGTARWLGVPVAGLLERAGVRPGADMVLSHSMDGGFTASTPLEALTDGRDAMIAVGMNGQVLPDKNGFPARMVVPGLFGYVSATKWLSRLEVTRFDAQTAYWTDRGWADRGPILTQSRIDVPSSLGSITPDRPLLAGVAWAQHRGIDRVEVRIDGGEWQEATLAASGGIDTWRQWSFRYDGAPGRHSAEVRATDGTGETQPEERRPVVPAGATGWHQIQFTLEG